MDATGTIPTTFVRRAVGYDPVDKIARCEDARVRSEPAWRTRELAARLAAPLTAPRAMVDLLPKLGSASGPERGPPDRG